MLINKDPSETLSNCRQKDGQWEMPLSDRNYRNEQRDRGSFYHAKENTFDRRERRIPKGRERQYPRQKRPDQCNIFADIHVL